MRCSVVRARPKYESRLRNAFSLAKKFLCIIFVQLFFAWDFQCCWTTITHHNIEHVKWPDDCGATRHRTSRFGDRRSGRRLIHSPNGEYAANEAFLLLLLVRWLRLHQQHIFLVRSLARSLRHSIGYVIRVIYIHTKHLFKINVCARGAIPTRPNVIAANRVVLHIVAAALWSRQWCGGGSCAATITVSLFIKFYI